MKAIIVSAGRGSRFGEVTRNFPKCLLEVKGKSILERQVVTLRKKGINDITIVKGFAADKIVIPNVKFVIDAEHCYDKVYSLMKAQDALNGDVLIIYGDILFDESVLEKVLATTTYDIGVVIDVDWSDYFIRRYGNPLADTVSLIVSANSEIIQIGQHIPASSFEDIYGQFIGFLKLSDAGCSIFKEVYSNAKRHYWDKVWVHGRIFQKARTTDFLQAIIEKEYKVYAIPIRHGWLEFDDVNDLDLVNKKLSRNELANLCRIED